MEVLERGGARLAFLGVVRGPVSDGERVRREIREQRPDAVAVSLGLEEVRALEAWDGQTAPESSVEEEVYARGMGRFGECRKPPPCYVEAVRASAEVGAALVPVDLDDRAYADAFTASVGTFEMIRHGGFVERKLPRHEFRAGTPQAFALEFDALITRTRGYRRVEAVREEHIAEALKAVLRKYRRSLALVEIERAAGVLRRLQA
jgi:hypothetical protein